MVTKLFKDIESVKKTKTYIELKEKDELEPDKHDGSYELVREAVKSFKEVSPEDFDFKDMNALYSIHLGIWANKISTKKEKINASHLPIIEKEGLIDLLDNISEKTQKEEYENRHKHKPCFGMFGRFHTFERVEVSALRRFHKMLIDISDLDDSGSILGIVEKNLKQEAKGIGIATVSQILHCFKPFIFPIINNGRYKNKSKIYESLGIKVKKPIKEISNYIENTREITDFRDANFSFKNFRRMDLIENKD